jgi:hypothetical protein
MRIWKFSLDLEGYDITEVYKSISIVNEEEVMEVAYGGGIGGPKVYDFPTIQARITHPTFAPDYFTFEGFDFISEKMRLLLDIDPDFVSYFDVDTTESTALVQAKRYNVMFNRAKEHVVDVDKSTYDVIKLSKFAREAGLGDFRFSFQRYAFLDDIKLRSHLFYEASPNCTEWFITDVQAMRLLEAGCTGFRCWDTRQLYLFREPRKFRTLQGLAEEGPWDPVRKVELTRMVEWF